MLNVYFADTFGNVFQNSTNNAMMQNVGNQVLGKILMFENDIIIVDRFHGISTSQVSFDSLFNTLQYILKKLYEPYEPTMLGNTITIHLPRMYPSKSQQAEIQDKMQNINKLEIPNKTQKSIKGTVKLIYV